MVDQTRSVMTERSIAMAKSFMSTTHPIGQRVKIYGGFGHGIDGRIVGVRQRAQGGPYADDYPVFFISSHGRLLAGYDAGSLDPMFLDSCPYCGDGACLGSPRTADGADIDRYYRHHPRVRQPDRIEPGYLLQCYGCLAWGTNEVFGLGNNRKCPNCGSWEVHNYE